MDEDEGLNLFKGVILPALLVFLVPAIALGVFWAAQAKYDSDAYAFVAEQVQADTALSPDEKAAYLAFWQEHPFSEQIRDPAVAADVDSTMVSHYAIFRWMIWLSAGSLISGVLVFGLAGLSVLVSRQSQTVQYYSLSAAWHTLRLYAAAQVVVQGVLLVALSFWVTALTLNVYSVKLVGITGILTLLAVFAILKAMWVKLDDTFAIDGAVLRRDDSEVWTDLDHLCAKVGTEPPDQIIAGIDDNFFVTEHPVTVDGTEHHGRSLYVSLSLLKQLSGEEADAVLAHEMAHFSGQDTTFSRKIAPLLGRYDQYLQALAEGGVTLPIFYFMLCFRTLFELNLRAMSREREFRADGIAAEHTSPEAMAGALLRIAAYSTYRGTVEQSLLDQEEAMEQAHISAAIESGFGDYAVAFAPSDLGDVATAHPFDTHPKMAQRLEAVGLPLGDDAMALLSREPDGRWFERIPDAAALERAQWDAYEKRFRDFHEEVLAWRYLPATDAETALVLKFFPERTFPSGANGLTLTHEHLTAAGWPAPVPWTTIEALQISENDVLAISHTGGKPHLVPLTHFGAHRDELIAEIDRYFRRAHNAVAHVAQQAARAEEESG